MKTMEQTILKNLFRNEQFTRKVIPYLKSEYFLDKSERLIFQEVQEYILKYNHLPTTEAIRISLENRDNVFEEQFKESIGLVDALEKDSEESPEEWLIETVEKWCQEKALHNAILESITILDNKDGKKTTKTKGAIPQILTDALAVSFDPNVGHDYLVDYDERFDFYHRKAKMVPFDLDYLNRISGGGLAAKTLTVFMAPPNAGKSLTLCHIASAALKQNFNVLYITMEMSQEKIAARIDANLLDTPLDSVLVLPKETYIRKIEKLKQVVHGKLIIKEYPTASAGSTHFRNLLNELNLKKQFKPDLVIIDYLNICCSSRLKMGQTVNSYTYVKAIAEELRGLAQEYDLPVVSATQVNRSGSTSSEPDMTDTSESFGLPMTVDNLWALVNSEELERAGLIQIKQLKNRDNDVTKHKRFVLGIDRSRMRLYDATEAAQGMVAGEAGSSPEEIYRTIGNNIEKLKKSSIISD